MKFADVKNDIAFRKIFGNQNKKEILISFLNAVLDFEDKHKITDVTILNPYQLPKFKLDRKDIKSLIEKWVFFIKEAENLEVIPEGIDDPGLRTAFEEANIQTWSPEEIEAYDYAGLRETEERLRLEKAKMEGKIEIVRQMKSKGMDTKMIADLTGMTEDEIEKT